MRSRSFQSAFRLGQFASLISEVVIEFARQSRGVGEVPKLSTSALRSLICPGQRPPSPPTNSSAACWRVLRRSIEDPPNDLSRDITPQGVREPISSFAAADASLGFPLSRCGHSRRLERLSTQNFQGCINSDRYIFIEQCLQAEAKAACGAPALPEAGLAIVRLDGAW